MIISTANRNDLSEILELQKVCYLENAKRYNDYSISPLIQTIDDLINEFDNNVILKAIDNNNIIGSLRAYEDRKTCYIGRVIVHPEYQNKGIGSRLMNEIEKYFPGVEKYELFTGYKDEKNLYFYNKLGYNKMKEEILSKDLTIVYLVKNRI